jgi:hypothetical protein
MVLNIDPNVVYGILVAIVLIVLIVSSPKILRARNTKFSEEMEVDPADETTQQWHPPN